LELIERTDDDLTDAELFAREADAEYWLIDLAITQLHRLPSELEATLLQREYLTLSAYNVVKRAIDDCQRQFGGSPIDLSRVA
jgi:hypothetical protein